MTTDLEARLATVEAHNAIENRMSAYIHSCDITKNVGDIVEHFTDDAVWEGVGRNIEFGTSTGKDAIADNFRTVHVRQPFTIHYLTNPEIHVDIEAGTGTGRWLCFEPSTIRTGTMPVWIGLRYENDFVFRDGQWLISHVRVDTLFATPYDKGWGIEMFTPVTATEPR